MASYSLLEHPCTNGRGWLIGVDALAMGGSMGLCLYSYIKSGQY